MPHRRFRAIVAGLAALSAGVAWYCANNPVPPATVSPEISPEEVGIDDITPCLTDAERQATGASVFELFVREIAGAIGIASFLAEDGIYQHEWETSRNPACQFSRESPAT